MSTLEATVDRWVSALVAALAFLVRFVILIVPTLLAGPITDLFTCWRYMLTASSLQYIWLGEVRSSPAELRDSQNNVTDGTVWFNFLDVIFQAFLGLPMVMILLFCVLGDIFSCNTAKLTATMTPKLIHVIQSFRHGVTAMANRPITWSTDAFWASCCQDCFHESPNYQMKTIDA